MGYMIPEPANHHDKNAVMIGVYWDHAHNVLAASPKVSTATFLKLGYMPKELAAKLKLKSQIACIIKSECEVHFEVGA